MIVDYNVHQSKIVIVTMLSVMSGKQPKGDHDVTATNHICVFWFVIYITVQHGYI